MTTPIKDPPIKILSMLALAGLVAGLFSPKLEAAQPLIPPYDSVQQEVVDGIIDDGTILVKKGTTDPLPEIRKQLKYTLGQLNWWDAAPKLSWFKIELAKSDPVDPGTGLVRVHYSARGHVAWSVEQESLSKLQLILPARGDEEGIGAFVDRYFKRCTNDPHAERGGYFFFFYPRLKTCPMYRSDEEQLASEAGMVIRFPMRFVKNDTNTSDKYPEYGKIWEDHKLVATVIFGKFTASATTDADEGIHAYNQFYSKLINAYGWPSAMNESFSGLPGVQHRRLKMTWRQGGSSMEIHLALVNAMANASESFISWYKKRTQESDVVIYNGHAGLGDNIEVLSKEAEFVPRKYQIFFVNGCDTFTYVNEELFAAHGAATPGAPVSKYLDIVTNSVSNYFATMANSSFTFLNELVRKENTYRGIMKKIDPRQRAVVDGEEDNTWPDTFRDWQPGDKPVGWRGPNSAGS